MWTAYGPLECLQYVHENGCPWDSKTCRSAAAGGAIDCLKYAHEHGCPWDEETCNVAARMNNLDCLKYAHEHGCPWGVLTCAYAAESGNLECLKYAHENGCSWDNKTFTKATFHPCAFCFLQSRLACPRLKERMACLAYAWSQGCPLPHHKVDAASSIEMLRETKEWKAAMRIANAWVHVYWNPKFQICKKRLQRDFEALNRGNI